MLTAQLDWLGGIPTSQIIETEIVIQSQNKGWKNALSYSKKADSQ